MRKSKFALSALLCACFFISFSFISCSDDDNDNKEEKIEIIENEPGKIPGLGNMEGELTGKPFTLPDGIELESEIKGYGSDVKSALDKKNQSLVDDEFEFLLKQTKSTIELVGSGYYVKLAINLKNNKDKNIDVEFPSGLIIKSLSGKYQHGLLIKKVKVTIPAKSTHSIALFMYCGNANKGSSSTYETYEWGVISNSSVIVDLCERLKNKKINYEEFASDEISVFKAQRTVLQNIVWNLTDYGNPLSEANIKYIEELPNSSN